MTLNVFTQKRSLLFIFIRSSLVHDVILPVWSIAFLNSARPPQVRADISERSLREDERRNWRGKAGGGGGIKIEGPSRALTLPAGNETRRVYPAPPLPLQRGGCCLCKCNHESRPVAIAPGIMPRSAWNDYSVALNSSHFVARQFGTRRQSLRIVHYPI